MANYPLLLKNTLLDWKNEKAYQEKILNDDSASREEKDYARKRIAEAEYYIGKITEELEKGKTL